MFVFYLADGLTHSECLICAMKSVLIAHRSTNNAIKPILIYSKLKLICKHFVHGQQEDAHEFLRYLIESMERSYLNVVGGLKVLDGVSAVSVCVSVRQGTACQSLAVQVIVALILKCSLLTASIALRSLVPN
ncbi:hypothetical protein LSTR_LSTR003731 [Laodelphax striatellus]|uniref:Peptidase C19 ubiquitin carboxyl-terminal hydrolase domain-containing protein n=1 Tax=Laodelphax striatellus TaxID=195883 RepID=A0A482WZP7_LAOST|nr:hypothetical protein LSTR_LSTR003731 [Laodelphax striatellus]